MPTIPQHHEWIALIIDDQRDNLTVASLGLELHGVQSHTCISGQEALELLKTVTPTFILLDIDMPHMNGYQVFDAVRAQSQFDNTPIIAITAGLVSGNNQQILDHGFNGLILKPFDIMNMAREIETHLKTYFQQRENPPPKKVEAPTVNPPIEPSVAQPGVTVQENSVPKVKPTSTTKTESEQLSDSI